MPYKNKETQQAYYRKNRKRILCYLHQYRIENKDALAKKRKKKYYENHESILESLREKRRENPSIHRETVLKSYRKHRAARILGMAEYHRKNRDRIVSHKVEYRRKLLANNPLYRTLHNLRARMRNALKRNPKSMKTVLLIGCSPNQLRKHIESLFLPGMTWDSYGFGGWHIDHIRPCSSFDLSDPEQQKQCFHYTNLQPLWWRDNLSKGSHF